MSMVAGLFYVNNCNNKSSGLNNSNINAIISTSTDSPMDQEMSDASGCSIADPETNLSDDENTSCSMSEMGYDSINTTTPTTSPNGHNNHNESNNHNNNNNHINLHNNNNKNSHNHYVDNNNSICSSSAASSPSTSSSRKNKRKNFKPRNIVDYNNDVEIGKDLRAEHQAQAQGSNIAFHDEDDEDHDETSVFNNQTNASTEAVEFHVRNSREEQEDDETDSATDDCEDAPLDLSEVQNDSKPSSWRKPKFFNNASTSKYGFNSQLNQEPRTNSSSPKDELNISSSSHSFPSSYSHIPKLQHSNSHSLSHFIPVDLRLGLGTDQQSGARDYFREKEQYLTESTMKELLSIYGLAENLRQAGGDSKLSSIDISSYQHHQNSDSNSNGQEQSSKILLPENMARFLAAVHESVNAAKLKSPSDQHSTLTNNNNILKLSPPRKPEETNDVNLLNFTVHGQVRNGSRLEEEERMFDLNTRQNRSGIRNENHFSNNHHHSFKGSNRRHYVPSTENGKNEKYKHSHLLNSSKGHKSSSKNASGRGLTAFPVIREGLLGKGTGPVDYTRYVKRYGSSTECSYQHCRDLNYKEHFHCLDCCEGARVFLKKEEMIRHFKWHKKRDESLQHGFMRYSPSDDCGDRFNGCPHNRKQTHYHCLQDGCEKVYISTSDVQMHANYHRKDSAIIQEGFQRFRAAEDCGEDYCAFRHQHTTHFHCKRDICSYTFKNKADMEKHKSYHIKDEQLNRDGFKKFMKHEICNFSTCRFSRVCNHIHCIREGCNYVLHSSGQLYSHKRKHERRDSELAYRKFKLAQTIMRGAIGSDLSSAIWNDTLAIKSEGDDDDHSHSSNEDNGGENTYSGDSEDIFKKFISQCDCDISKGEHYHCRAECCLNALIGNFEVATEHSKNHELEDRISSLAYFTVDPANFDAQDSTIPCVSAKCVHQHREKHYHCLWDDCPEIILATDEPFKRLEHFRFHEKNQKLEPVTSEKEETSGSLDGFFKRKRGRPPKDRTIEVSSGGSNDALFTSFKLPKPRIPGYNGESDTSSAELKDPIGFTSYPSRTSCNDETCPHNSTPSSHYHCAHPRCHFAVADVHKLSLHLRDFHSNVDILDGYAYYDRGSNCKESKCEFNGVTNHFHCTRDGYIFQRYSSMTIHETENHENKSSHESSDDEDAQWNGNHAMKSIGKFLSQPSFKGSNKKTKPITDHSLTRILQLPESSETKYGPDSACGRPFCKLKRKSHFHCHLCNQAFSEIEKLRPHVLKHSNLSNAPPKVNPESEEGESDDSLNQAQECSELGNFGKDEPGINNNNNSPNILSQLDITSAPFTPPSPFTNFLGYPGVPSPYMFLQQSPFTSLYAGMMFGQSYPPPPPLPTSTADLLSRPPSNPPSLLIPNLAEISPSNSPLSNIIASSLTSIPTPLKRPASNSSSPTSPPSESKKQRIQLRMLKDEPVPDGYVRFRFNEDCSYIHCGYREHQTHFHCTREDCGYSFCDKTRFVQHTARHERLDTLMGGDFKQYRANVACGRDDCVHIPVQGAALTPSQQNKASHFHCSKCEFVCTDTNKVVAHRRQHQKLDSIMAAGFEKFTPTQSCNIDACIHALKQTHYHCLKCNYAVLGLSQMSAHKFRHNDC